MVDGTDAAQVNVVWTKPADTGDSPLLRFELQYRQEATDDTVADDLDIDSVWADATTLSLTSPLAETHKHTGLPGNVKHVYRVRAVNATGASGYTVPLATVLNFISQ